MDFRRGPAQGLRFPQLWGGRERSPASRPFWGRRDVRACVRARQPGCGLRIAGWGRYLSYLALSDLGCGLAQWNKKALRTRLGCGMWAQAPGDLLHPRGRGHVLEELLPPIPAKSFSSSRDTLSGGQQSLCSPLRASIPSLGCFLHQHFSPGLHLCSFYGVQCFSSLLPFPLLAPLSPSHPGS